MGERSAVGHRTAPHTADVRIEAWAPSRERCVAEAVGALVDSFVDLSGAQPTTTATFRTEPGKIDDMLVAVLDEVIYRMDTTGQLPAGAEVTSSDDGGLEARLSMVDVDRVELVGAVPKAVSLHELRCESAGDGWTCAVTLDV